MKSFMISKFKLSLFLLLFTFMISMISCDSLEETIRKSKYNVTSYGPDLYYRGVKVGYHDYDSSLDKDIKQLMKKRGLWISKVGFILKTIQKRNPKTGKYITVTVTQTISTKIYGTYRIFNSSGENVAFVFCMGVPYGNKEGWHSYYYVYDRKTKEITELLSEVTHSSSIMSVSPKIYTKDADNLFSTSKEEMSKGTFSERYNKTLSNETLDSKSLFIYFNSSLNTHLFTFLEWSPEKSQTKIETSIKPIILTHVNGGFAVFNSFFCLDYETNFGLLGGDVKTGNEAQESFNINENASFFMKAIGGFYGIELNYMIEHFQYGNYDYYTSSDPETHNQDQIENIKFETKRRQIAALYHFTWKDIPRLGGTEKKRKIPDIFIGYTYLTYKTIKIAYEELNEDDDIRTNERVVAESTPQLMEVQAHMLGFGINNSMIPQNPGFNLLYSGRLFIGRAESKFNGFDYYYDPNYVSENDALKKHSLVYPIINIGLALGIEYNTKIGPIRTAYFLKYDVDMYNEMMSLGPEKNRIRKTSTGSVLFQTLTVGFNCYF